MARVITAISFDLNLKFGAMLAPRIVVHFANVLPGKESHARTTIVDEDAARLAAAYLLDGATGGPGLLAEVNAAIDAQEASVAAPADFAARVQAADDARKAVEDATATKAALDAAIAAKTAELATLAEGAKPSAEAVTK